MKSYDRIADSILEKYNSRLEAQKRRKAIIMRTAAGCAGLCAAAVIGFGVWNSTHIKGNTNNFGNENIVSDVTTMAEDTTQTTTAFADDETVTTASQALIPGGVQTKTTASSAISAAYTTSARVRTGTAPVSQSAAASHSTVTTSSSAAVTAEIPVYERSIYMKKIPAFLAAVITASSVSPSMYRAESGDLKIPSLTPPTRLEVNSDEYRNVLNISEGSFDLDLNSDGNFDIFDVYALYRSVINAGASGEMREKCRQNADYNSDGMIDLCDSTMLMYYFALTEGVKAEYYDDDFYKENCPDKYADDNVYAKVMKECWEEEKADADQRKALNDEFDEEEFWKHTSASLRSIADKINVLKTYDEPAYSRSETVMGSYPWDGLCIYKDPSVFDNVPQVFADEMRSNYGVLRWDYPEFKNHCDSGEMDLDVNGSGEYDIEDFMDIVVYVSNHNDFWIWRDGTSREDTDHHEYAMKLDDEIESRCDELVRSYESVFHYAVPAMSDKYDWTFYYYCLSYFFESNEYKEEYADYDFYTDLNEGTRLYTISTVVEQYVDLVHPEENNEVFSDAVFQKAFKAYIKDVEDGKRSEPDVNMDGVFDEYDYIYINLYSSYLYNGPDIDLPGLSYGRKLTDDIISNIGTSCDYSLNGKSGDIYDIMIVECYCMLKGKMYPEVTAEDYFNEKQKLQSYTSLLGEMDVERNGDANCDGGVDMADTVKIMQSLANPDKYELSVLGSFNGDVSETGNGITVSDALGVQKKLLKLS
ncbi:hypothetical protein [Ruminococcus flavefaciens]|uniref:hypothetical protein n=1 Tax=Ruminococcus flavefaciens TaxID=1265 RepID=UPI0026F01041|nr:hypothetical protein [Ruminococcus flavefaciens]